MNVDVKGQHWVSSTITFSSLFLRQDLSHLTCCLLIRLDCWSTSLRELPVCSFLVLGFQVHTTLLVFLCTWELLGLTQVLTFSGQTLPQLSHLPSPLGFIFYWSQLCCFCLLTAQNISLYPLCRYKIKRTTESRKAWVSGKLDLALSPFQCNCKFAPYT